MTSPYENHPFLRYTSASRPLAPGSPLAACCDAFTARLRAANVPKAYVSATLLHANVRFSAKLNGTLRRNTGELADWLPKYERSFTGARPRSLYLFSRAKGVGKTTTACRLLVDYIAARFVAALKDGETPSQRIGFFLDMNEWQALYNGFNRSHVPDDRAERISRQYYAALEAAQASELTVCDDLGVRQASEGFRGDVHELINSRVVACRPTIYTSNIPIDELVNAFDDRLADRVRENCFEIEWLNSESKRGIRTEGHA